MACDLGNRPASSCSRFENWVSKADLDTHLASPHIAAFRVKAPELLAEPANITLWSEIEGD
jgi:quinol monooxygenase YgiN